VTTDELRAALAPLVGTTLADDLIRDFIAIRQDVLTGVLERSNAGKLVESFVQALQYMERTGQFDAKPNVDSYLDGLDHRTSSLDDGLRFSASRIARAMYTLRNKRNIAHKGPVDPNQYDLRFLLHGAQWLMAELLRNATGIPMGAAGLLIELVQAPVGGLVEDRAGRSLVLKDLPAGEEILVLLQHAHPAGRTLPELVSSMNRRLAKTVRNAALELWRQKDIDRDAHDRYVLTANGARRAAEVTRRQAADGGPAKPPQSKAKRRRR
jgi:hypothetical protein